MNTTILPDQQHEQRCVYLSRLAVMLTSSASILHHQNLPHRKMFGFDWLKDGVAWALEDVLGHCGSSQNQSQDHCLKTMELLPWFDQRNRGELTKIVYPVKLDHSAHSLV